MSFRCVSVLHCDRCPEVVAVTPAGTSPGWGILRAQPQQGGASLATADGRAVHLLCPACMAALASWLEPRRRKAA